MTKTTTLPTSIKIVEWDAKLPIGDWSGPDPVRLFPRKGVIPPVSQEDALDFRVRSIEFAPTSNQQEEIQTWVQQNIPQKMQWLILGLNHTIKHLPKTFYAVAQAEIGPEDKTAIEHPEMLEPDWQERFDTARLDFIAYLQSIHCPFQLSSAEDLLDSGQTIHQDRDRPPLHQHPDLMMGTSNPPKYLWRYLDLRKFKMLLKQKAIWFSKPQYFDDPHEFSLDTASQRAAIVWRLNSFRDAYNRAIRLGRSDYLETVSHLIDGLPIESDGTISACQLRLSQLSPALLSSIRKTYKDWQESFLISCWRYAEKDNVAMWNQYASMDAGIAIVADHQTLQNALHARFDIRLTPVEYRDLAKSGNDPMRTIPLSYKDIRFQTEEEYRFYFRGDIGEQRGLAIPINLSDVLTSVHVSPHASGQHRDMVKDLLKAYGLEVPVQTSPLAEVPTKF